MKKINFHPVLLAFCFSAACFLQSCYAPKKYHALQDELSRCQSSGNVNQSVLNILKRDTAEYGLKYRNLDSAKSYIEAVSNSQKKHFNDELAQKIKELNEKEKLLNEKDKKVKELNSGTAKKDSFANSFSLIVGGAMTEFPAEAINISAREGKVYLSVNEKLLFKPNTAALDHKYGNIITNLSIVIRNDKNIQAVVIGNTDSMPAPAKFADNWDFSMARASALVKALVSEGAEPYKFTIAGRGEFQPVAQNNSAENRAQNRRIDIIFSMKDN